IVAFEEELFPAAPSRTGGCGLQFRPPASSAAPRRSTTNARAQMAATKPGDGRRAHRPYLESRRTPFVSRPSSQGLKPVSRLRGTVPCFPVRSKDAGGLTIVVHGRDVVGFSLTTG